MTVIQPNDETLPIGFVVLGQLKGGNAYHAVIECSFSMDLSPENVNLYWIGTARDNLVGAKWELTENLVRKTAEEHRDMFSKPRPDWEFKVWDMHDPNLPIIIDWDSWKWGNTRSEHKLSGVRNKFLARNPKFKMKD
jgi:hypothetical protein